MSTRNRDLELTFNKYNFILIFTCHCSSVVPNYLLVTYCFPTMLFSRAVFTFRLGRLTTVLSYSAVALFLSAANFALSRRTIPT